MFGRVSQKLVYIYSFFPMAHDAIKLVKMQSFEAL